MSAGGKKRRGLTDEDEELWHYVTRNVAPDNGKPRVLGHVVPDDTVPERETEPSRHKLPPRAQPKPKPKPEPPLAAPAARKKPPLPEPKPVILERKKARRIARGEEEIDARLDLHGMTQDAAHGALVGFIRRCHADGLRMVLIITGKGGAMSKLRQADDEVMPRPRGVLRQNVPRWLGGSEIGAFVVSYSAAHISHGGDGALYVRLRRKG